MPQTASRRSSVRKTLNCTSPIKAMPAPLSPAVLMRSYRELIFRIEIPFVMGSLGWWFLVIKIYTQKGLFRWDPKVNGSYSIGLSPPKAFFHWDLILNGSYSIGFPHRSLPSHGISRLMVPIQWDFRIHDPFRWDLKVNGSYSIGLSSKRALLSDETSRLKGRFQLDFLREGPFLMRSLG